MNIREIDPPILLEKNIIEKINKKAKQSAFIRFVYSWIIMIGSSVSIIPAVIYLNKNLHSSGFYDYFSLIFLENTKLFSIWKEISMSLAESLPFMALAIFLAIIGIFVWSLSKITKDSKLVLGVPLIN